MITEPPRDAKLRDLPKHAGAWATWCCVGGAVAASVWLLVDGGVPYGALPIPFLAYSAWTDLTRRALIDPATAAVAISALVAAALTGGLHLVAWCLASGVAAWILLEAMRRARGGIGAGDPPFLASATCVLALLPSHPTVSSWASADLFRTLAEMTVVISSLNAMIVASLATLGLAAGVNRIRKADRSTGIPVGAVAAAVTTLLLAFPSCALWVTPYFWMDS